MGREWGRLVPESGGLQDGDSDGHGCGHSIFNSNKDVLDMEDHELLFAGSHVER